LAQLAHELRTPLAAISALSEVMRDERLGPVGDQRYRAYAADIHHSAQQALAVLASYLEAGERPDQGGELSFVELHPEIEAERSVSALRPVAERAGVLLEVVHDQRLPRLIADRRSLRQILDNLIVNAIKFTPPGGQVRVHVRHVVNGPLEISVADTGDGIAPLDLARLLERCAAPATGGPRRGGGGIGLPLVRAMANANGGELAIASERGRGTRVTITFGRERLVLV
jgi:signal transduction histidine kinase